MEEKQSVAILGASDDRDRYAFLALELLLQFGHNPIPISPKIDQILGINTYKSLTLAPKAHTLTMYVNAKIQKSIEHEILNYQAKRVIFNPGTENLELEQKLRAQGVEVIEGCTLVMLKTNQF